MPEDKKNISRHILPTASNMLGLCFLIFSIVKVNKFAQLTLLDEMTAFSMLLFLISCLFSYASIRARSREARFERIADIFFMIGLISLTSITLIFVFEVVR